MQEGQLLVRKDGFVATLIISNEEKHNALTPELIHRLKDSIKEISETNDTRVIIITGAGPKAFCSGFDITKIQTQSDTSAAAMGAIMTEIVEETFSSVRECKIPTIAMINGFAIGAGLDLAVNCDFRISHSKTRFGITPAKLGLAYHYAGIKRFVNHIGISAAKYLFYTGELIESSLAHRFGLIDFVVEEQHLEKFTYQLARDIAENSAPLSVSLIKYVVNACTNKLDLSEDEISKIRVNMNSVFNSQDLVEGQLAFIQKRKPNFVGK